MKNKTIIFIVGIFLISLVFAQISLGTFKQGEDVVLTQGCINSTYSNITLILYPNSTISMSGQIEMSGNDFYNYTYTDTGAIGQYLVYGQCNEAGTDTAWVYDFEITPTGKELTASLVSIYVFISLTLLILSILIFTFGKNIDNSPTDGMEEGKSKTKSMAYKLFFYGLALVLFIGFILYNQFLISDLLGETGVSEIYSDILYIMLMLTLVLFIWIMIMITINSFKLLQQRRGLS